MYGFCHIYEYRSGNWWEHIVLCTLSATDWLENFRMSKETFSHLCNRVQPSIKRRSTQLRQPISVEKRIAITLWYLVMPMEYRSIGHLFGVAHCTASVIVHETCTAIVDILFKAYISFPKGEQVKQVDNGFQRTWGVPQCCGAIDGCLIPISAPAILIIIIGKRFIQSLLKLL